MNEVEMVDNGASKSKKNKKILLIVLITSVVIFVLSLFHLWYDTFFGYKYEYVDEIYEYLEDKYGDNDFKVTYAERGKSKEYRGDGGCGATYRNVEGGYDYIFNVFSKNDKITFFVIYRMMSDPETGEFLEVKIKDSYEDTKKGVKVVDKILRYMRDKKILDDFEYKVSDSSYWNTASFNMWSFEDALNKTFTINMSTNLTLDEYLNIDSYNGLNEFADYLLSDEINILENNYDDISVRYDFVFKFASGCTIENRLSLDNEYWWFYSCPTIQEDGQESVERGNLSEHPSISNIIKWGNY